MPRVRRGATQRDYRLLYYKFFRFPENPEPRHFSSKFSPRCAWQGVCTTQDIVKIFPALRAAWSRLQRLQAVRQTTNGRLQTTRLLDFRDSESWPYFKLVCRQRTICSCSLLTSFRCSCILQMFIVCSLIFCKFCLNPIQIAFVYIFFTEFSTEFCRTCGESRIIAESQCIISRNF